MLALGELVQFQHGVERDDVAGAAMDLLDISQLFPSKLLVEGNFFFPLSTSEVNVASLFSSWGTCRFGFFLLS